VAVRPEAVRAELDENKYPKGIKVSDAQLAAVNLSRHSFHGHWNYTIAPRRRGDEGPLTDVRLKHVSVVPDRCPSCLCKSD
jgi:hypothetical protein